MHRRYPVLLEQNQSHCVLASISEDSPLPAGRVEWRVVTSGYIHSGFAAIHEIEKDAISVVYVYELLFLYDSGRGCVYIKLIGRQLLIVLCVKQESLIHHISVTKPGDVIRCRNTVDGAVIVVLLGVLILVFV